MTPLSRRQFLSTAAAGLAMPSAAQAAWWGNDSTNLYDMLEKFHFLGQDGNPVGKNALEAALKGKPVILSFFYKGCGATDPEILTQQAKIADAVKPGKLIHLVIDTNPYTDAFPPFGDVPRVAFLNDITQPAANPALRYPQGTQYLPKENTVVLYPLNAQGKPFDTQQEALQGVKDIEKQAGGLVIQSVNNDEPGHFSRILLYGPDGNPVTDPNTQKPLAGRADSINMETWIAAIKTAQQGRSR